jgi:hypothetical protein
VIASLLRGGRGVTLASGECGLAGFSAVSTGGLAEQPARRLKVIMGKKINRAILISCPDAFQRMELV